MGACQAAARQSSSQPPALQWPAGSRRHWRVGKGGCLWTLHRWGHRALGEQRTEGAPWGRRETRGSRRSTAATHFQAFCRSNAHSLGAAGGWSPNGLIRGFWPGRQGPPQGGLAARGRARRAHPPRQLQSEQPRSAPAQACSNAQSLIGGPGAHTHLALDGSQRAARPGASRVCQDQACEQQRGHQPPGRRHCELGGLNCEATGSRGPIVAHTPRSSPCCALPMPSPREAAAQLLGSSQLWHWGCFSVCMYGLHVCPKRQGAAAASTCAGRGGGAVVSSAGRNRNRPGQRGRAWLGRVTRHQRSLVHESPYMPHILNSNGTSDGTHGVCSQLAIERRRGALHAGRRRRRRVGTDGACSHCNRARPI